MAKSKSKNSEIEDDGVDFADIDTDEEFGSVETDKEPIRLISSRQPIVVIPGEFGRLNVYVRLREILAFEALAARPNEMGIYINGHVLSAKFRTGQARDEAAALLDSWMRGSN